MRQVLFCLSGEGCGVEESGLTDSLELRAVSLELLV